MLTKQILSENNIVYQDFFENREKYQPLVFFGAGAGVYGALAMFKKENAQSPIAICDNNEVKWGTSIENIPIISLKELQSKCEDFYVLVTAPANAHFIISQLEKEISKDKILFFTQYEQNEVLEFRKFLKNNQKSIENIYAALSDQTSKDTLEMVLKGRNTGDFENYKKVFHDTQYFAKDIFEIQNETFLDVGAFDGDTIKKFIDASDNSYKKVIGLEPHPVLFNKLKTFAYNHNNIEVFNVAAGEKTEEQYICFDENDYSKASIAKTGSILSKVVRIDDIITEPITFIKMDIEGFEMQALKGAVETIKKYKPKLAVCLYHKYTDFVDIPQFILDLNLGYKLYIRHHTYYMGETVFYCV